MSWLFDYTYASRQQLASLLHPGGAEAFRSPPHPLTPAVVLLPGIYERWQFMRPLATALHRQGYPVHVVHRLGLNRGTIPAMARRVAAHIEQQGLSQVVLIAHSKGGLIGKYAMVHDDPDHRIRAMVAINTPFAGSTPARWIPLTAVRAFVPTDATLTALADQTAVNARITAINSSFDPHIPNHGKLPGAVNAALATPGHLRVLGDPQLLLAILEALRRTQHE
ncbi:MAG: alpha/beta hydrolase [Phycicoccus sp.]|nr:alpha/beta hydrolase [Phycicoccus sp.]